MIESALKVVDIKEFFDFGKWFAPKGTYIVQSISILCVHFLIKAWFFKWQLQTMKFILRRGAILNFTSDDPYKPMTLNIHNLSFSTLRYYNLLVNYLTKTCYMCIMSKDFSYYLLWRYFNIWHVTDRVNRSGLEKNNPTMQEITPMRCWSFWLLSWSTLRNKWIMSKTRYSKWRPTSRNDVSSLQSLSRNHWPKNKLPLFSCQSKKPNQETRGK